MLRRLFAFAIAVAFLASACQPTTGPGGSATASGATQRGGTLTFAIWQEPNTLYPYYATQTVSTLVYEVAVEGLLGADPDGNYIPVLARAVPTVQNGAVQISGSKMNVTYRLRPGVKWSDGQPFSSKDVRFTWELILKDKKVTSSEGYDKIESIDTPDDTTAIVHYKEIYAPYLSKFFRIVPEHVLAGVDDVSKTDYVRMPIGTGPFKITEFQAADHITAERNPNYRESGKPLLDRIIFRSVPSREVAIAQLKAGEVQGMWNLLEAQVPELEKDASVALLIGKSPTVERLEFNLAKPANPADPSVPHPVLGDVNVRRALLLATPKQQMIDKLLFGKATAGTSPAPLGWFSPKGLTQEGYDPAKAKQLLDQAGWKPGADGIRQKDGVRASLTITTTTGDKVREQYEQVLVDEWKAVGVELKIKNVPSSVLFGSWAQDAPRKRGNFDVNMYASSYGIDPHTEVSQRFACNAIPTPKNNGAGFNYNRFCDKHVDELIAQAGSTPEQQKRTELYRQIFEIVNQQALNVWLYDRSSIDAFRKTVSGYKDNPWDNVTWTAAEWSLRQ